MSKKLAAPRYLNPPFDPRMLKIGVPSYNGGKLVRGRVVQAEAPRWGVHFLYNPLEVSATHSLDLNITTDPKSQVVQAPGLTGGYYLNQGSVSLSLLYDRTYELWDHSKRNTLAGKYGCYADVLAYYQMLKITDTGTSRKPTKGSVHAGTEGTHAPATFANGTWSTLFPVRPLAPVLVYLIIGDKLRYYGVIDGLAVTYSHWNKDMIPTRCAIDLSMSFQPDPHGNPKVKIPKGKPHKVGAKKP